MSTNVIFCSKNTINNNINNQDKRQNMPKTKQTKKPNFNIIKMNWKNKNNLSKKSESANASEQTATVTGKNDKQASYNFGCLVPDDKGGLALKNLPKENSSVEEVLAKEFEAKLEKKLEEKNDNSTPSINNYTFENITVNDFIKEKKEGKEVKEKDSLTYNNYLSCALLMNAQAATSNYQKSSNYGSNFLDNFKNVVRTQFSNTQQNPNSNNNININNNNVAKTPSIPNSLKVDNVSEANNRKLRNLKRPPLTFNYGYLEQYNKNKKPKHSKKYRELIKQAQKLANENRLLSVLPPNSFFNNGQSKLSTNNNMNGINRSENNLFYNKNALQRQSNPNTNINKVATFNVTDSNNANVSSIKPDTNTKCSKANKLDLSYIVNPLDVTPQ